MTLDATASAQLSQTVIKPVWFGFLDIAGGALRVNTSGADRTPTGTGDPDLDDHLFSGISAQFVDVGRVKQAKGGSETVTVRLSGLPTLDADLLALIGDPANWQGRVGRLWRIVRNSANVQQGAFDPWYTGYMTAMPIKPAPDSSTISVKIEHYLSAFSQASNASYLDQTRFDPDDLSATVAIAIANGTSGNPLTNNTPTPGGYGGGGVYNQDVRFN
ncbi:MAG: hypothetical protein V4530_06075 [Pseudomonadota bacterium]